MSVRDACHDAAPSRSHRRRMRKSMVVKQLWTEKQYTIASMGFFPFVPSVMQAPWQPEVESQPNHIGIPEVRTSSCFWPHSTGDSEVADGPSAFRYRDDKSGRLVDVVNQTHQPLYEVIHVSLSELDSQMCEWLYGDGIAAEATSAQSYIDDQHCIDESTNSSEAVSDDASVVNIDIVENDLLDDIRYTIAKSLFCLEDFVRWKARDYNDIDALEAVESRFDYGHVRRTPDGWKYIEEDFDEQSEADDKELLVNKLGHLFTYRRPEFWQHCPEAPFDLRKDITAFAVSHPACEATSDLDPPAFEEAFRNHDPSSYSWQGCHNDDHEEDELMTLLRLLRKLAEAF